MLGARARMKYEKNLILLTMLLAILISMPTIRPAQAHINQWTWLPPYVSKVDGSYVIYKHGSTAQLEVPVYNDIAGATYGLNVSKVIISFDWGGVSSNKTLDFSASPVKIKWHETYTFTVSFLANATEAVSSAWQHIYTIYVENVNVTGASLTPLSRSWDYFGGSNRWKYIVYSTNQSDALDLQTKYSSYVSSYPLTYFTDADARQLAGQAQIEGSIASNDYTNRQNYDSANTRYQTALNLYSEALTAEKKYKTAIQNASLNTTLTTNAAALIEANAAMVEAEAARNEAYAALIEANAALNQSYAWILFGIGFVIISTGVLMYLVKKPRM